MRAWLGLSVGLLVFSCESAAVGPDGGAAGGSSTGGGNSQGGGTATGGNSGGGAAGSGGGLAGGGVGTGGGTGGAGAGTAGGAGAGSGGGAAGGSAGCAPPAAFDVGLTYSRTLYVSANGSPNGDGSMANPFNTISAAVQAATPGTRILVGPGTYPAVSLGGLSGTAAAPIALVANGAALINGAGGVGISMSDGQYVVIEGFTIANSTVHGMNLDDGSSFNTPSHHIVLRRLTIPMAGTGGNNDCIKLSGLDDFWVLDSTISGCNQGEAIDMVGCHRGVIANNTFRDVIGSGVQTKGGSEDVVIHRNRFERIPSRAVNAGGSTDVQFFRPQNATAEARNIRVLSNLFLSGGPQSAAVAFVGCDSCIAAHNTIVEQQRWVVRILQENTDPRFVPSRDGYFINNIVVVNAAQLSTVVNVGANTMPNTFTFGNNLWFALDRPGGWTPPISGVPAETGSIVQQDPQFVNRAQGNYDLTASSPAGGAARALPVPRLADFTGTCFANPASIGAFER